MIATLSCEERNFFATSNIITSGFPTIVAFFPVAYSIDASMAPVAGTSPSGVGKTGSRFVAKKRAPFQIGRASCRERV